MTKNVITQVLYKGRYYEWWCLKEGTAVSPQDISNSQVCFINNNKALSIARSALLVKDQEI